MQSLWNSNHTDTQHHTLRISDQLHVLYPTRWSSSLSPLVWVVCYMEAISHDVLLGVVDHETDSDTDSASDDDAQSQSASVGYERSRRSGLLSQSPAGVRRAKVEARDNGTSAVGAELHAELGDLLGVLRGVDVLKALSDPDLITLCDALLRCTIDAGELVMRQGARHPLCIATPHMHIHVHMHMHMHMQVRSPHGVHALCTRYSVQTPYCSTDTLGSAIQTHSQAVRVPGERSSTFYLIARGTATVSRSEAPREPERTLVHLGRLAYFGERATPLGKK